MELTRLIKSAAQNAFQKLVISNPGTIPEAAYRIKALIIKVKRPRLSIFIGKVKKIRTGLTNTFKIPNTNAANTKTFKSEK